MKPIFCGNFDFEARSSDLERLFRRYGRVDRVDMKSGYAFIYMDDERDADYAIRALDRSEFGRKGRRLRVEWSKQERNTTVRKSASSRRSANLRPAKTLFVINFPYDTKTRDLERHFEPYGKIVNVRIRRNFAFVEYESVEDAIKALEATNMSKLQDRVISVEYSARENEDNNRRGGGYSPDRRGRDRSPDRRRSPSPYRRERGSPDYGTGSSPAYRRERGSPDYGTRPSRSPRRVERSPIYGARSSRSPRRVERSFEYGNGSNRSPRQASRRSPPYGRERSISPRREERRSPDVRDRNQSPLGGERNGNGNGFGHRRSASPEEGAISDDAHEPGSPINKPDLRDESPIKKPGLRDSSPIGDYGSPVDDRYRSPSPPARERSRS